MARFGFRRRVSPLSETAEQPLLRNSEQPFHTVTHRAIGDIPGCIPAPRSGTFVNTTPEQARAEAQVRVDAFCKVVEEGDVVAIKNFNQHPLFGAFGEKL